MTPAEHMRALGMYFLYSAEDRRGQEWHRYFARQFPWMRGMVLDAILDRGGNTSADFGWTPEAIATAEAFTDLIEFLEAKYLK